jgi:hypothetical protein
VNEETWRQHMNERGQIEDDFHLRRVCNYAWICTGRLIILLNQFAVWFSGDLLCWVRAMPPPWDVALPATLLSLQFHFRRAWANP